MKKSAVHALLLTLLLVGCTSPIRQGDSPSVENGKQAEPGTNDATLRPVDLSRVDRVRVAHPASSTSKEFSGEEASRLARALANSPARSTEGSTPPCREELSFSLYAGTSLITTAWAGVGDRPIIVDGENLIREPSPEAKQLLQSMKDLLADPYMAQFIPYCAAWEAARTVNPDAPWRLIFMPEVGHQDQKTEAIIPTWIATAIWPAGNREKLYIDARVTGAPRLYRVAQLEAEEPPLPAKEGKRPLTAPEMLAQACQSVDCNTYEPVDIEFRANVPLPMAGPGDTFPAWAVTFVRSSDRRMDSIHLYEAYSGGLVSMEMPPK